MVYRQVVFLAEIDRMNLDVQDYLLSHPSELTRVATTAWNKSEWNLTLCQELYYGEKKESAVAEEEQSPAKPFILAKVTSLFFSKSIHGGQK